MVNLYSCRAKAVNAITSDSGVQEHVEEVPLAANDVAVMSLDLSLYLRALLQ